MIKDKILVIDDEAGIRSSLKGILEDEGFSVTTTDTGETGLDILKNKNFDLVLLDIWLPQMSGLDVLAKLKTEEEDSQVVMISGHGSIATADTATTLGAFDFLEKPLSLEKVVLTVKNALRQKKLVEENEGRIALAKVEVDADENMKLAGRYQVRGFPTVLMIIDGNEVARFSGAKPLSFLRNFVDENINKL